jgi:hypothetical protein
MRFKEAMRQSLRTPLLRARSRLDACGKLADPDRLKEAA